MVENHIHDDLEAKRVGCGKESVQGFFASQCWIHGPVISYGIGTAQWSLAGKDSNRMDWCQIDDIKTEYSNTCQFRNSRIQGSCGSEIPGKYLLDLLSAQ